MTDDRRGAAMLEFALVFPVVLLFVFGLFAGFSLVMSWRAMDVGVAKALRYAAVHGGGTQADVSATYASWAGLVWRPAADDAVLAITPASFPAGTLVTVTATYNWTPAASLAGAAFGTIFTPIAITARGTVRVMN